MNINKFLDTLEDPRSSVLSYRSQITRRSATMFLKKVNSFGDLNDKS
jgi:hypothetical protein